MEDRREQALEDPQPSEDSSVTKYSSWRDPDGALQKRLFAIVDGAEHHGVTVRETYPRFSSNQQHPEYAHHGWISGALSMLHADLRIVRLSERRDGCKVYVTPDFIDGRRAEAQGRGGPSKEEIVHGQSVLSFLEYWLQVDTEGARFGTDKTKAERNQPLFFRELKAVFEVGP